MNIQCSTCGDESTSTYVCTTCGTALAPRIPHKALTMYLTPPPGPLFWDLSKEQTPAMPRHTEMSLGRKKVSLEDAGTVALIDQLEAAEAAKAERRRKRHLIAAVTVLAICADATVFVL